MVLSQLWSLRYHLIRTVNNTNNDRHKSTRAEKNRKKVKYTVDRNICCRPIDKRRLPPGLSRRISHSKWKSEWGQELDYSMGHLKQLYVECDDSKIDDDG